MAAGLHDPAAFEDVDPIGVQDGREPVRDQHRHRVSPRRDVADRIDDPLFGQGVERGRGFVEDDQMGAPQQGPRDRQPLLFTTRHLDASLTDERVEAAVRPREQVVAGGLPQHIETLGVCGGRVHEQQVLADGSGEQLRILVTNHPRAQPSRSISLPGIPL